MFHIRTRHHVSFATMLVLSLAMGACDDDPIEEEEPEVATMRLTVGTQTINVNEAGVVTGGPIAIPVGSTAISVQWLKDDGSPETIVTDDVFELDIETNNAGVVTFSRTGAFTGNLVGAGAGSTTLDIGLLHVEEGHHDFGPFPVPVTVS